MSCTSSPPRRRWPRSEQRPLDVYIIDGHALLAVPQIVLPEHLGDVFGALDEMVTSDTLQVSRAVIDAVRRRDPNGAVGIWANAVVSHKAHAKVEYKWQLEAQALAQKAGYEDGLEDTLSPSPSGSVEVVALGLFWLHFGRHPVVVTEDWSDKPTRPALGSFCAQAGWDACRVDGFLQGQGLDGYLS